MTRLSASHPAVKKSGAGGSSLEAAFLAHLRTLAPTLPPPEREYIFAPPRKWRFDFVWPRARLAVEVEGGVWSGGRHTRPQGFENDVEKYNTATVEGWRVLRCTARMLDTDPAAFVALIVEALEAQ